MSNSRKEVTILNESGMHLRPAAAFVQAANRHKGCEVAVEHAGQRVNGKSIMGLVMLAAAKGTVLTIDVSGDNADQALDDLVLLIDNKFGTDE